MRPLDGMALRRSLRPFDGRYGLLAAATAF